MKLKNLHRVFFAAALAVLGRAVAAAAGYELTAPVYQGGENAGFQVLIFSNRNPQAAVQVAVDVEVLERDTQKRFAFATSTITVPAAQLNTVIGDLGEAGAQMLHWDLKQAGFERLKGVRTRIRVLDPPTAAPPSLTWSLVFTGRRESRVAAWFDQRRFKVLP
jgi:hypothetical protein